MLQAQHYIELPGPEDMASFSLKKFSAGESLESCLAASACLKKTTGDTFFQMSALAAAACAQAGSPDASLKYWDDAVCRDPQELKWLEAALLSAYGNNSEKSAECRKKWQNLLQCVYTATPGFDFLKSITAQGWQGAGSIGIHAGKLMGWLWVRQDDALQISIDSSESINLAINLKKIASDEQHALYSFREEIPKSKKPWSMAFRLNSGLRINGSPIRISSSAICPVISGPKAAVTILIPVYGDKKATLSCLGSVFASLKHNHSKPHILVAWDQGPDISLLDALRKFSARGKCSLLENQANLGFLASVNNAISHIPEGDIILLNSDTLVHGDWIDRMTAAAKKEQAATVTALGNEAELMSYPSERDRGKIAGLREVALLDSAAAKINKDEAILEIPVGVGFCMLITRKALNRIGGLDGAYLYRGYGEEADFCLRAKEAGLKNYGAFNVFVGHMGERSFGAAKKALAAQNNQAIYARFPKYSREYHEFLFDPRPDRLREALSLECLKEPLQIPKTLEIRPWNARLLPPWIKDKVCEPGTPQAALFIRPGKRTVACLRIWANIHLFDINFSLPEDLNKLKAALSNAGFENAVCSSNSGKKLAEELRLPLLENPDNGPDLPKLPADIQVLLVSPPTDYKTLQTFLSLATFHPNCKFLMFFKQAIWPAVPGRPNILELPAMPDYSPLSPDGFLLTSTDYDGWRFWLDCHGCENLPFYRMEQK